MDRYLARLDRRFGKYAIEGLPTIIVGGMAIVYVLAQVRPDFLRLLVLSPELVARGQVWRLVTYLFIPPDQSTWFIIFTLYLAWMIGSNLEAEWGAFKLNAYYLIGMLGTTAAALITGGAQGNWYLNMSVVFAFTTLFPEYEIRLFFLLPIRMKWLGWLAFAFIGYEFVISGDWPIRGAIIAALSNYLLFFWGEIMALVRGGRRQMQQGARRSSRPPPVAAASARACAVCGAKEADEADIRVCSCEKCKEATGGKPRELCLEHARSH